MTSLAAQMYNKLKNASPLSQSLFLYTSFLYRSLGKFTIGYFHLKLVCGKIFSSLGVSNKIFLTTKYFMVKLFVLLPTNLMHKFIHNHAQVTIGYNFKQDFYRGTSTRELHIKVSNEDTNLRKDSDC